MGWDTRAIDEHPDDEEKREKLDEDNGTPFSPPSDIPGEGRMARDDPRRDDGLDEDEEYNEGENAAASQPDNPNDEPHTGRRVG